MRISEALAQAHADIARLRRMITLLNAKQTQQVMDMIETRPEEVNNFRILFERGDPEVLRHWIGAFLDEELGALSITKLRVRAQRHHIPFYYRLSKIELIQEINNAEHPNRTTAQTDGATNS